MSYVLNELIRRYTHTACFKLVDSKTHVCVCVCICVSLYIYVKFYMPIVYCFHGHAYLAKVPTINNFFLSLGLF